MALKLSFEERRVVGTLVEKAYTTPEQCPLTLNSLVTGCNQKSCRNPVTFFDENKVLHTLDGLRAKGLAVLVRSGGSRVDRWRQSFADNVSYTDWERDSFYVAVRQLAPARGRLLQGELVMVEFLVTIGVGAVVASVVLGVWIASGVRHHHHHHHRHY